MTEVDIDIRSFGTTIDQRSYDQLVRSLDAVPDGNRSGVLCADHHPGYPMPIGGVLFSEHYVSPAAVGFDIACGNLAVATDLHINELRPDLGKVMDEIASTISFGMGRKNSEKVDSIVLDQIANSPVAGQRKLVQLAQSQLGTVGSGNHYVDLFEDMAGMVWVGVHFGSRGFGHKTASGFLNIAAGKPFEDKAIDGGMDSAPSYLDTRLPSGQDYLDAMSIAGDYAYAGREWVVNKVVRDILKVKPTDHVHNHHNFAWMEFQNGTKGYTTRKGATPAWTGQRGFIGGSMGDISVIASGTKEAERMSLASTVHGAGRVMSRTEAAGKVKRRKVWQCGQRDCGFYAQISDYVRGENNRRPTCPTCGGKLMEGFHEDRIREGKINWPEVQESLALRGIELRGAGADEAPGVYKSLISVLGAMGATTQVDTVLFPVGVAMAGKDEFDPYKD